MLLRAYEGSGDSVVEEFRPNTQLAVTIPTVDPRRGRLTGIAVQLPTLVRDEQNNEFPWPHAEWSVRDRLGLAGRVPRRHALGLGRRAWRRTVAERSAAQRFPTVRGQPVGQVRAPWARSGWD